MPCPMRSCAVIDFYTLIIYHIIQREYLNNIVSDNIDAGYNVQSFDSKVDTKKLDSALYMGKVGHYYGVVSISDVDFIDKQRNDIYGKNYNVRCIFKHVLLVIQ